MRWFSESDADSPREDAATSSHGTTALEPPPSSPARLARIVEGAKGGFVATLVMTGYRLPISHALPPTALFWSKFVAGGDPNDHPIPGLVLHLLYGTVAGAAFGATAPERHAREVTESELAGLFWGTLYGLALSAVGERVLLNELLDLTLDSDERLVFHVGHLIYGLTLGTWLGSRTGDER